MSYVDDLESDDRGAAVMAGTLLAVLMLPLAGALVAGVATPARRGAAVGVAAVVLSAVGAAALLARVAASGPESAVWTGAGGRLLVGVAVDRLTGVLLLLVCAVSAVAQGFAGRYLAGDRRQRWFVVGTGVLTAASAGLMTSVSLLGVAACWSGAGFGLWLLLGTYPDLPAARDGQRRAGVAFLLGDAALWAAVGIATARWGSIDLRQLDVRALPGAAGLAPVIGCLLVAAALTRSAQVPFQRWLPATLAAPTPVSALLHAGVVNAGGVLLVRLAPLASSSRLALGLAFAAGAVTVVYGTVLMVCKPDVKGALAHSTMGQMGFMIMTCGLGLYAAAVIHLVLHGLYKASLFLASGTAIHSHVSRAVAPPPPRLSPARRRAVTAAAIAMPGVLLWSLEQLLHPSLSGTAGARVLLFFAWATAGAAALGWLRRHPHPLGLLSAVGVSALALAGYVALIAAADRFLTPALPAPAATLPATGWLLAAALLTLGLTAVLSRPGLGGRAGRLGGLHRRVYVLAMTAAHVRQPRPWPPEPEHAARAGWPVWAAARPIGAHS